MGAQTAVKTVAGTELDLVTLGATQWINDLSNRGIFTTNTALVICSWNAWLVANTGLAADCAIGRSLFDLFPSIRDRGFDRYYREALGGESRILSESLHKYLIPIAIKGVAGGVEMSQSTRIGPIRSGDAIVGTVTAIDDVTERVVMERELRSRIAALDRARLIAEENSRLKDEFLATLSHEIRTPLNAVLGWTRILRTQQHLKSRDHALDVIERNAASQLRLIEDLLDTARVISGKLRLEVRTVRFEDVVQAAIEVVTPAATAKGIPITTSVDVLPTVQGDADRLQQVVWNLLSNAVKFTARGGHINVSAATAGDSVVLTVRDTGEGIDREFLPYVFDRFRQADASTSRRQGGLGLGLALVRQLVELHGGTVTADSAGIDTGTIFTVRLPAGQSESPPKAPWARDGSVTIRGLSVLVVEDDRDGRAMLVTILKNYGARVRAVASAASALRILAGQRFKPDVLLSDIGLSGTDGLALIEQIRGAASARMRRLPAIAVTAYANPEDRDRALRAGFQAHLPKPIDAQVLIQLIDQLRPRLSAAVKRRRQTARVAT